MPSYRELELRSEQLTLRLFVELFDDLASSHSVYRADQSGLEPVDSLSQKCGNDITISKMEREFQSITKHGEQQCAEKQKQQWRCQRKSRKWQQLTFVRADVFALLLIKFDSNIGTRVSLGYSVWLDWSFVNCLRPRPFSKFNLLPSQGQTDVHRQMHAWISGWSHETNG